MQVFHYCADVLKEMPLFESCKDVELFRSAHCSGEGSVYNDFDHDPILLLNENSELENEESNDDSQAPCVVAQVDDEDIGRLFLAADNMSYNRWRVKHQLFDLENNVISSIYLKKV